MAEPNKPLEQMTAQERFDIGGLYFKESKFNESIAKWSKITRDDGSEFYAWAQFNIGNIWNNIGNLDEAIAAWSNVRRSDNLEAYAWAQFNVGLAYQAQNKLNEAIRVWSKIHRKDNRKTYAQAQFSLGLAHHSKNEMDEAITAWSQIRHNDDPETYTWAQLNLGLTYHAQNKLNEAIKAWSNVHRDDDPETYAGAQLCLGEVYSLDEDKKEQAHEAYDNVREFFYYKSERGFKILKCTLGVRKDLHRLAENTDKVLKSLQITPKFESKVAHYTRPQIAFNLFGDEKNNKNPSNFRLNTIRGVNDPTEGLVLSNYWDQQGIRETIHTNDTATFISCFTFNHDNLNQFRLYGKENGREATGVSLVFNKDFFSNQADTLEFIAGPSTDLSSKSEHNKSNETGKTEDDNKKQLIGKSTLYRCIYLDPETGHWTLAQRDKSTFYREHNEDEDTDAKEKWEDYYELISEIEGCVEKHLFNKGNNEEEDIETHLLNKGNNDNNSVSNENNKIKSISQILNSIFIEEKKSYNKFNKDEKQKILEAIRFTLLPLQYLVKHIAFQEEQECRIMYITQFRDEKIHSDREKQWMYVEYKEPVLPHIDKIWLSPGAAKDQDFFRILLDQGSGKSKVRISQNPFRNKE